MISPDLLASYEAALNYRSELTQRLAYTNEVSRTALETIAGLTADHGDDHEGLIHRIASLALIEIRVAQEPPAEF